MFFEEFASTVVESVLIDMSSLKKITKFSKSKLSLLLILNWTSVLAFFVPQEITKIEEKIHRNKLPSL